MRVRCLNNNTLHKSINLNDVLQSINFEVSPYTVFVVCHFLTISFKYEYFPQRILRALVK